MIMVVVGKDILYGKNGVVVGLLVAVGVCPFWEGVESGEGEVVEVMFSWAVDVTVELIVGVGVSVGITIIGLFGSANVQSLLMPQSFACANGITRNNVSSIMATIFLFCKAIK